MLELLKSSIYEKERKDRKGNLEIEMKRAAWLSESLRLSDDVPSAPHRAHTVDHFNIPSTILPDFLPRLIDGNGDSLGVTAAVVRHVNIATWL